jgi:hypothetical protein
MDLAKEIKIFSQIVDIVEGVVDNVPEDQSFKKTIPVNHKLRKIKRDKTLQRSTGL